ncbi:MAG: hypothetical protein H0V76_07885 [Blastocatellia bacterium]|nr:hypothetical protein [Blastocatellia bacterium]
MTDVAPEQVEIQKKRRLIERLAERLADREEEMAHLRGDLERFEVRYTMEVGCLYARQDEVDALVAEEELKLVPDDEEIKKKVEELRRLADESAARTKSAEERDAEQWEPTPEAKRTYHDLARVIHPDLAIEEGEKARRHTLMAELNEAYSSGDQIKLNKLAANMRMSPEMIMGDSPGDALVRAVRQIYQVRKRLIELKAEKSAAEASELFDLFNKVEAESAAGRDLLRHMAERAKTHILKTERRLENLQNVNRSAEQYVKEKFDMDIADFR